MRNFKYMLKGVSALLAAAMVAGFQQYIHLPEEFTMLRGEAHALPAFVAVRAAEDGFLMEKSGDSAKVTPTMSGSFPVDFSVFGVLKKAAVIHVVDPQSVVLGGKTVGMKLYMDGVLVVGMSEIPGTGRRAPGKEAGIMVGDRILAVDGETLSGSDALEKTVAESGGRTLTLSVSRGGKTWDTAITPVYYADGESYKIGLWVRESTAGIGTVTFSDPKTGAYAALGHGIEDPDTGVTVQPARGSLTDCKIAYITKSQSGAPGELCGVFGEETVGSITKNTDIGLYGVLSPPPDGTLVPIAVSTQVESGAATVYSDVAGGNPVGYAAEIQQVFPQKQSGTKNMIVRVTDERLLRLTGGIVQGM